jgi:hypothetical protein
MAMARDSAHGIPEKPGPVADAADLLQAQLAWTLIWNGLPWLGIDLQCSQTPSVLCFLLEAFGRCTQCNQRSGAL